MTKKIKIENNTTVESRSTGSGGALLCAPIQDDVDSEALGVPDLASHDANPAHGLENHGAPLLGDPQGVVGDVRPRLLVHLGSALGRLPADEDGAAEALADLALAAGGVEADVALARVQFVDGLQDHVLLSPDLEPAGHVALLVGDLALAPGVGAGHVVHVGPEVALSGGEVRGLLGEGTGQGALVLLDGGFDRREK